MEIRETKEERLMWDWLLDTYKVISVDLVLEVCEARFGTEMQMVNVEER
jgi:hypothetical protein